MVRLSPILCVHPHFQECVCGLQLNRHIILNKAKVKVNQQLTFSFLEPVS